MTSLLLLVATLYLLLLLAIAWFSLHPIRIPIFLSPGAMGAPQEDVEFESRGQRLRGWWIEAPGASSVMILSHGYLMNRCELTPLACELWRRGVSCLVYDFPAHGKSQGTKSFLGVREAEDVAAAIAYARSRTTDVKIGLLGSSMGAAASAIACGDAPGIADVLILDSAYARLSSAVLGWWRFVGGDALAAVLAPTVVLAAPMAGFNPFGIDVSTWLAKAGTLPTLLLHGDADTLALPNEARRNYEACAGEKKLVFFSRMGHSEARWMRFAEYNAALFAFLEGVGFM